MMLLLQHATGDPDASASSRFAIDGHPLNFLSPTAPEEYPLEDRATLLLGTDTNLRDNGAPLFGVGTNAFRHRAGLSGFRLHALGVKRFLCVPRAQNAIELGIEARNDRRCCPCRRHQRYPQNCLVAREAGLGDG